MRFPTLTLVSAIIAVACGGRGDLDPAPGAQPAPSGAEAFEDSESGVRMIAEIEAWTALPRDLESHATPVLITLENNGAVPIRVRYDLFHLKADNGRSYPAIPPYDVRGETTAPVDALVYTPEGFLIARHLSPFYPRMGIWDGVFDYDPRYYDLHTEFVRIELPTSDMIVRALPEGVLQPGGRVQGFLYFRHVHQDARQANLSLDLSTPGGERFGELAIPFIVD